MFLWSCVMKLFIFIYMFSRMCCLLPYLLQCFNFQCGFKMLTWAGRRKVFTNIRLKRYMSSFIMFLFSCIKTSCEAWRYSSSSCFFVYLQCRCCFDVEIVYLCKHLRILMVEVSVNWTEIPGSKVRMTRILHVVYRLVLVKVGYGLRIWKMYS
jgi:dolichyl-phosphate beta-glucosyltransferase